MLPGAQNIAAQVTDGVPESGNDGTEYC